VSSLVCIQCGFSVGESPFCGSCGATQVAATPDDPRIGLVIGGRYDVVASIGEGGMGSVYRARQRSLGRDVAIKFIHRSLVSSAAMVERFMSEARVASSLNHPNVVSIYDFGRTSAEPDGEIFLVMELLGGDPLARWTGVPMPLPRVVTIVRQILAALSEAHDRGVVHRDLKPENVLVERLRGGDERVKVIDFGIARVAGDPRLTEVGRLIGTPRYMAPEYALGREPGAAADLYAVGVMLFELLTGRPPFEDHDPGRLIALHLEAPRPDPVLLAPDRALPRALGDVCRRAMAIDPAERFLDAQAFAEALVRAAATERWTAAKQSQFPSRRMPALSAADTQPIRTHTPRRTLAIPGVADERGDSELDAAIALILAPTTRAVSVEGPTGCGRTTLIENLARNLSDSRVVAVDVISPPPGREVGYATLSRIIERLLDVEGAEVAARVARTAPDPKVHRAVRAIFSGSVEGLGNSLQARAAIALALAWAAKWGVTRHAPRRVVLLLDDADRMDGASLAAITDLLCDAPVGGLTIVATSESAPDEEVAVYMQRLHLEGWSRATAARILSEREAPSEALGRDAGPYEPLYVLQCARWWREFSCRAPATLTELVEWRVANLPPSERRVLQAVAVLGVGSKRALSDILPNRDDIERGLPPLVEAGLVTVTAGSVAVTHAIFARVAVATAPRGTIRELHARASALYETRRDSVELRTYHRVRSTSRVGIASLADSIATLRASRGDIDGAIDSLDTATNLADDVHERAALWRRRAAILLEGGRVADAADVLADALAHAPDDHERARVMELLAQTWNLLGRHDEAEHAREQSLVLAESLGDKELADRVRKPLLRSVTGPRLRLAYRISEIPSPQARTSR